MTNHERFADAYWRQRAVSAELANSALRASLAKANRGQLLRSAVALVGWVGFVSALFVGF